VVLNDPVITVDVTASKARWLSVAVGAMKLAAALLSSPVSGPCRSQMSFSAASTDAESRTSTRLIMGHARAAVGDRFCGFGEHRLASAPQMHLGSVLGQVRRHATAQAGTAAGDQDPLVRQQVGCEDVALRCAHGPDPSRRPTGRGSCR